MNKHGIEIEYIKGDGQINSLSFSSSANNLSSEALNNLISVNAYANGFNLNSSDLSGNYKYYNNNGVKYYVSSDLSDEYGNINITLTIVSSGVSGLTLLFPIDVYPTSILVNGVVYENSNEIFQTATLSNGENVTTILTFQKMNKENHPLIILSINSGIKITYDDRYIKSIQRGSQLSTDNELPNYEIVSQYGNVSFIDADYVVLNLKNSGTLRKPKKIKILLNDEVIGIYKATSWEYDMLNNLVSIELSDSINEISEVEVESYQEIATSKTLYDVFLNIKSLLEQQGEVFSNIEESLSSRLSTIKMYVYRYDNTNLQTLVNNFCNVAQCSIYKNEVGELEVYSWR